MVMGGAPVTEEETLGLIPTSPLIVVAPVFVIADPARIANGVAVPSLGWVAASAPIGQAAARATVIEIESSIRRRRVFISTGL